MRRNAPERAKVVDCKGHVLCPGLIDMQVFTGEPGLEHRETLKTASHAAAAGGVTTIVVMPDTEPVIDQVALVDFIQRRARDNAVVNVHVMAAMTRGLKGQDMTEIGLLKRAGAIAFTNGKSSVANTRVMRNVLLYSRDHATLDRPPHGGPASHRGQRHERRRGGDALGLPGVHKAAETIVLERRAPGRDQRAISRRHAVVRREPRPIRAAKERKLPVTCGVSVNHLTLNENDIGSYRTFLRLRPPRSARRSPRHGAGLRRRRHRRDRVEPRSARRWTRRPFRRGADGAIGLETLLAAALRLYHNGEIGLALLRAMTINPAQLLGLPSGRLEKGAPPTDPIDLGQPWVVDKAQLRSRSKNSPFDESKMQGRVLTTMVAGRMVYQYAADRA